MNKYKYLILFSSILLSFVQVGVSTVNADTDTEIPIYNPVNPNQVVDPVDSLDITESSEEPEAEIVEAVIETEEPTKSEESEVEDNVEDKVETVESTNRKRDEIKQVYLDEHFFEQEEVSLNDDSSGGAGFDRPMISEYVALVSEFTGTVIYGRKN